MQQRYPIAYVRRSSADADNPGDVSREAQEAAIRELAHRDGHNGNLRLLVDWDKSADEAKESKRTAFLAMLAAIEAGEVSAVYAASLDRLYRSIRTFVRLTDAARTHGVRIVTAREGVLGGDGSPMAQAFAEITAVFAGLELRTAKARAAGALAVRQARGDHVGRCGYGRKLVRNERGAIVTAPDPDHPLAPILAAVREAGSILGGAKLLQARGIPSPDGKSIWGSTTLRRIIESADPSLLPKAGPSGRRTPSHSTLAQLLVCHCGHVLTPEPARKAYRCTRGNRIGREAHGAVWVGEKALMPWIMAEADRFAPPIDQITLASEAAGRGDALQGKRTRWIEQYGEGLIDKAERDRRLLPIDRELREVVSRVETIRSVPARAIDWTSPPEKLNVFLRSIWRHVTLDDALRPIQAEWSIRKWRR